MISKIRKKIYGTNLTCIIQELLTNSLHFPIANIILEALFESSNDFFKKPDIYAILFASIVQGILIGNWKYKGKQYLFIGNLIGPFIYTAIELVFEGPKFFYAPHHIAYWLFSALIGLWQQMAQQDINKKLKASFILLEHLTRTSIVLVMYWIFEARMQHESYSITVFLSDSSHVFVSIFIPLLGIVVGFANVTKESFLSSLKNTTNQLSIYSEWFLGDILSEAMVNSNILNIKRKKRAIVFMDIRGFTKWSENKTPEEVVSMLNTYFEDAELCFFDHNVIKVKHTADEIMCVCPDAKTAVRLSVNIIQSTKKILTSKELSAGVGVHEGEVVEGLIGSSKIKSYDVIGDTVNTAKRICENALGGEILLSEQVFREYKEELTNVKEKLISAKGKSKPLKVYSVNIY